jgi:hypothetical protein
MKFKSLTIVSIYGSSDGSEAIPALGKSLLELPGSCGLLISVSKPSGLPSNIQWVRILPMDYRHYSLFVMFSLHNFINSDYYLIVQQDGWVLNGQNWRDEFFDFDYIGAPCHAALVGNQLISNFKWVDNPSAVVIQNGGFSLRSLKLLKAPSQLGAMYYFSDNNVLQNEDVQLSGIFKTVLENNGIKFAPVTLAKYFSLEYAGRNFNDDISFGDLFGLHGQTRKLIGPNQIIISIPDRDVDNIYRERELLNFLRHEKYDVYFK